jgi:hypothetical protein
MSKLLTYLLLFFCPISVLGQGAKNAFAPDSGSRCINSRRDYVWAKLGDMKTGTEKGLLTKDANIAVVLNTTVKASSGTDTDPLTFPTVATGKLAANGKVGDKSGFFIPIQLGLVNQFQLNNGSAARFSEMDFETKLIHEKKANAFGTAIKTLADLANDLPLPPSPYTTGARYFAKYANTAIANSLQSPDIDKQPLSGRTVLQFGSAQNAIPAKQTCSNPAFANTGTYAVVDSWDATDPTQTEANGYVDIGRLNDYCWIAEYDDGITMKWQKRLAGGCDAATHTLKNNYIPIVISALDQDDIGDTNALQALETGTPSSDKPRVQDALDRCSKLHLKPCLPLNNSKPTTQP